MPRIELTETALETLDGLEVDDRERILTKLSAIGDFPEHYLDGLSGVPGFVLRVGDFRVIVDWDREADVIFVVAVLARKHGYRELGHLGEIWGVWRE